MVNTTYIMTHRHGWLTPSENAEAVIVVTDTPTLFWNLPPAQCSCPHRTLLQSKSISVHIIVHSVVSLTRSYSMWVTGSRFTESIPGMIICYTCVHVCMFICPYLATIRTGQESTSGSLTARLSHIIPHALVQPMLTQTLLSQEYSSVKIV